MASEITRISYSDYLDLIKKISSEGISSSELKTLKCVFPNILSEQHDLLYNEVAGLVSVLINGTFEHFQKKLNLCLQEGDPDILVYGIRDLKRNIDSCLFFTGIDLYPEAIRKNIGDEVIDKFLRYSDDIDSYMVRLLKASSDAFVEDLRYILKRAKLQKYIAGYKYESVSTGTGAASAGVLNSAKKSRK